MTKTTKKKAETPPPAATAEQRRWAATAMVDGTACSAVTAHYLKGVGEGAADVHDVRGRINDVARGVADGDLSGLEKMLLQQAAALQAMFAHLATMAKDQTSRDNLQVTMSLALKAAAGSRQAITALAELRMPKQVLFAKQANVNNGGQQQVNNGMQPAQQAGSVQGGVGAETLPAPETGTARHPTQAVLPRRAEVQSAGDAARAA